MGKYSLDITLKDKPFINIEVEDDRVLLGAYEDGKIARRLFFINKEQLGLLIDGIWLAVDYDGIEKAFWNKPKRCEKHREWWGDKMVLPKGSIKKLIGRELSWSDEPVELKED